MTRRLPALAAMIALGGIGCAATATRAYVEPSAPDGAAAVLKAAPYAGTVLEIAQIDGTPVGLTNHPSSNVWQKETVVVRPGRHAVEISQIARSGAAAARHVVPLLAEPGHTYEVVVEGSGVAIRDRSPGVASAPPTWSELNARMVVLAREGRYAEAAEVGVEALRVGEQTVGENDVAVATARFNLGYVDRMLGRQAEAERLLQQAAAILQRREADDPAAVARVLFELAQLYDAQGRDAEAEPLHEHVFRTMERTAGPNHPETMTAAASLARSYQRRGLLALAQVLFRRVMAYQERALKPNDPQRWFVSCHLAEVYHALGQHQAAEPLYQRALRAAGTSRPDERLAALNGYARLLRDTGRFKQAARIEAQAATLRAESSP